MKHVTTRELIEDLHTAFPLRLQRRDEDAVDYARYCGKVELVHQLIRENGMEIHHEIRTLSGS